MLVWTLTSSTAQVHLYLFAAFPTSVWVNEASFSLLRLFVIIHFIQDAKAFASSSKGCQPLAASLSSITSITSM
jgi:hypothetical protein